MMQREIRLEAIWSDPDLLKLRCIVHTDGWQGVAAAYTTPEDVAAFAACLEAFLGHLDGAVAFEAGAATGIGLVALRLYPIDRARHLACHVRLASQTATEYRPEELAQLALEVRVEPAALGPFASQLRAVAATRRGAATLLLVPAA